MVLGESLESKSQQLERIWRRSSRHKQELRQQTVSNRKGPEVKGKKSEKVKSGSGWTKDHMHRTFFFFFGFICSTAETNRQLA